jgi:hypothetical protein
MCMLDVGVGEELMRTQWGSLVPKHLQVMEWVREDDGRILGSFPNCKPNFASFKLAARPV